jgi:hypothetical protein
MVDTVLCNLTLQVAGVLSYTGSNWTSNSPEITFSNASGQNPLITADTAGIYLINLQDTVCNFNETFSLTFVADPFTSIIDTTLCIGETATLAAVQQPQNVSYLWSTGANTPTIQVTEPGNYLISATNMCGTIIDTASIEFYFCDIELPNVFTPNGDGNNDYFQMLFYGGLSSFECIIVGVIPSENLLTRLSNGTEQTRKTTIWKKASIFTLPAPLPMPAMKLKNMAWYTSLENSINCYLCVCSNSRKIHQDG